MEYESHGVLECSINSCHLHKDLTLKVLQALKKRINREMERARNEKKNTSHKLLRLNVWRSALPFSRARNVLQKKATIRNVRKKKSVRRRILVIYKNKWCFRERLSALGFLSTCSFPLGAGALSRDRSGLNEIFGSFLSSECGFCSCYSSAWLTENR